MRRYTRSLVLLGLLSAAIVGGGSPASAGPVCDTTFRQVSTPPTSGNAFLNGVDALTPDNAWAVGSTSNGDTPLSLHLNGTGWHNAPVPIADGYLSAVAMIGPHNVWAFGSYVDEHGLSRSLALHRTGSAWTRVQSPNIGTGTNTLYDVAAIGPDDIWAAGSADAPETRGGGVSRPLVVHWNGTRWKRFDLPPVGGRDNFMEALTAPGPGDAWVVIQYPNAGGIYRMTTFHRSGNAWHQVTLPQPSAGSVSPRGLLAIGASNVWMTGFYRMNGHATALFEQWNGAHWVQVDGANPEPDTYLEDLAAFGPHDMYAFGGASMGSSERTTVEHFNGTTWKVVATMDPTATSSQLSAGAVARDGSDRRVWGVGQYFLDTSPYQTLIEQSCPS